MKNNKNFKNIICLVLAFTIALSVMFTGCSSAPESESVADPSSEQTVSSQETVSSEEPVYQQDPRLADAYAANNDVVGWLTVDGCEVDNRIFQAADNNKYLRVDEDGNYDVWGCYFLDYINVIEGGARLTDKVSIIYGHSFEDASEDEKISKLKRYRDAEFAAQHPTIKFDFLNGTSEWQIFSACQIPVTIDYIDPNPYEEKYQAILDYMINNSYVDFGVDVTTDDQILVLSTCTSDENVRFILVGKLVE